MMRAARRTTDGDARGEGARRARGRGNGGTRDAGRRCAPNAEERGRTRKDPIASDSCIHSFAFILIHSSPFARTRGCRVKRRR